MSLNDLSITAAEIITSDQFDGKKVSDFIATLVTDIEAGFNASAWTPTITDNGASYSFSPTVTYAQYWELGDLCIYYTRLDGTATGTEDATRIEFTTPVGVHPSHNGVLQWSQVTEGGTKIDHRSEIVASTDEVSLLRESGNWGAATIQIRAIGLFQTDAPA